MRFFLLALPLAACGTGQVELIHHSTMLNATRGVVMLEEGVGHGAMLETTCSFNTLEGHVINDVNLPTPVERVGGGAGSWVFGYSPEGVHTIRFGDWLQERDVTVPNVIHANGTERRTLWLRRDANRCLFGQQDHQLHQVTETDIGACSDSAKLLTLGRADRTWLVDDGSVTELIQGERGPSLPGDVATIDIDSGTLYTATGPILHRYDLDGDLVWSVGVDRPVTSIANLGARNGVAAVLQDQGLTLRDSQGGSLAMVRLPGQAEVVTSDSGDDLALVTEREVHFYTLADEGQGTWGERLGPIEFED